MMGAEDGIDEEESLWDLDDVEPKENLESTSTKR
jgi:hypothetical protein